MAMQRILLFPFEEPVDPKTFYPQIDSEIAAGSQGEAARSGSLRMKLGKFFKHIDKIKSI